MKKVDLSSGFKTCATCLQDKPVSEFYAHRHPGRKHEAPRRECKTCYNKEEYRREQEQKRLDQYVVRDWHGEVAQLSQDGQRGLMSGSSKRAAKRSASHYG